MSKSKSASNLGKERSKQLLKRLGSKKKISAYFRERARERWEKHPEHRSKKKAKK